MELGQLGVSLGAELASGVIQETLGNGTTEVVRVDLHGIVGRLLGLLSNTLKRLASKGGPEEGFPDGPCSLKGISILVVTESEVDQGLSTQLDQLGVELLRGTVVEDRILLTGPVVGVTQTKDGKLGLGDTELGSGTEGLPELAGVDGELSLTSSRDNKDDMLLERKIFDRDIVHSRVASREVTELGALDQTLGKTLGVGAIRAEE